MTISFRKKKNLHFLIKMETQRMVRAVIIIKNNIFLNSLYCNLEINKIIPALCFHAEIYFIVKIIYFSMGR